MYRGKITSGKTFYQGGLGERLKGHISSVIPAMVTNSEIEIKVQRAHTELPSPIFGKTSQSKGYLRLRSRDLVFVSPCLFFYFFSISDRPCLHKCFNSFLSKMV